MLLAWSMFICTVRLAGNLTGTPEFMAVSVQQGRRASVASELESVLYIGIKLCSDAPLHWHGAPPTNYEAKLTAMTDASAFEQKVQRTAVLSGWKCHVAHAVPYRITVVTLKGSQRQSCRRRLLIATSWLTPLT
jgi:hypothetical protein